MTDVQSSMQSLEEIPPMIAVVGSTLLKQIQEWPDVPPEWAHLAATCVVLADTMAWRCEEVREALPVKPQCVTAEEWFEIPAHQTLQ